MPSSNEQFQRPEEQELESKKAELALLETDLLKQEIDLATLRAELTSFENQYLLRVGVLYADLDDIEARIAELVARRQPTNRDAQTEAAQARARADETARSTIITSEPKFFPNEKLKKIFRDVAKQVHPDLATSDDDRARRQALMAEANLAYEQGDEAKLLRILHEWKSNPDLVDGEGVGAELIRVIRKIAQIRRRILEIDAEVRDLSDSNHYQLWVMQIAAEKDGRDLILEIILRIERDIESARARLATLITKGA